LTVVSDARHLFDHATELPEGVKYRAAKAEAH